MAQETIYSDHPEEVAKRWCDAGAERIHLVDLNGAVEGLPVNKAAIEKVLRTVSVPVQLGGGIRDFKTIETYLDMGIQQVILGTIAYKNPGLVELACDTFPERIILGIDAKQNQVAVEGWREETHLTPVEMARKFQKARFFSLIYTDILRDGMQTGPNVKATGELAKAIDVPVIASGGISGIEDVARVLTLEKYGVTGMITGRALYERTLDLGEAIRLSKNR